jgi:hypothetical protein
MRGLHLVHDVLDAQLLDRRKEKIGRVDALVLELDDGEPPRVSAILLGGPVRAERIGRVGVAISRLLRTLFRIRNSGVSRIPFSAVTCIGETIEVDIDGTALASSHVEAWLADNVIRRIPGGEGEKK